MALVLCFALTSPWVHCSVDAMNRQCAIYMNDLIIFRACLALFVLHVTFYPVLYFKDCLKIIDLIYNDHRSDPFCSEVRSADVSTMKMKILKCHLLEYNKV